MLRTMMMGAALLASSCSSFHQTPSSLDLAIAAGVRGYLEARVPPAGDRPCLLMSEIPGTRTNAIVDLLRNAPCRIPRDTAITWWYYWRVAPHGLFKRSGPRTTIIIVSGAEQEDQYLVIGAELVESPLWGHGLRIRVRKGGQTWEFVDWQVTWVG